MRLTHFIIVGIVLFGIIGDLYFRDFFRMVGLIILGLFIVFLIIYDRLDHKGYFNPKKKDKES